MHMIRRQTLQTGASKSSISSVVCVSSNVATNSRMHLSVKFKSSSLLWLSRKLAFPVSNLRRHCTFCFIEHLSHRISFCPAGGFIGTEQALHTTVYLMDTTRTSADMPLRPHHAFVYLASHPLARLLFQVLL